MGIKFASGGFLTTVQDMGRTGYQESGMSVSGVYGSAFRTIANILVGMMKRGGSGSNPDGTDDGIYRRQYYRSNRRQSGSKGKWKRSSDVSGSFST